MDQHGAADQHGDGLPNLGSEMEMDIFDSIPSAGSGDNLTEIPPSMYAWCNNPEAPWNSLNAVTALSGTLSRVRSGTNTVRSPVIPRNAADLPPSFTEYRWTQPPPSECSTQPPVDIFASDSGYGTVLSAPRLSIANTSVFGDNNTDTQSLAGHLSNFELQTNSLTPIEAFYKRTHGDVVSRPTAYGSQPAMQGPSSLTCRYCRDTFKTRSQLKKHMQRHDKMHFCKEPGCTRKEGFSTQNDLDRHKRSKHPATNATGRRYRCHLGTCKNKPKKWPRADNFRQHLKRRHKDEVEDDDLEQFVVHENAPTDGGIDCGSNVDTETEYLGAGPLHVELSDVGQDLRATGNPQQVRWATAEDALHAYVEDDLQHGIGEQPQLSLEVPFDAAGMMVGGQFTVFSPTTPDSQDVNLQTIDNPSTVDFDLGEIYRPTAASARPALTAENQCALTPIFSSQPEDLGLNIHDPFHNHGGLFQDFSDPPRITIEMVAPDNDNSSLLNYDDPHRRSLDTLTDVYTHDDDDDSISVDNNDVPGDIDAPGENDAAQHARITMGSSCPQESENDSGGTTQEESNAASPAATPLPEQVSEEKEQDEDSGQTTKTAFLETLKAGDLDEILKQHGYRKHPPSQAAARRRSSSQTSGGPSTEVTGNFKCPDSGCSKTFNRECELRKHMRRHEKPYGCTFRYCTKRFGSKSDWKRHENSQHEHLDGWRCDILVPFPARVTTEAAVKTTQPCGKQCHRRETFRTHLQRDHGLIEDQVVKKLEQCHYGKDCESRFWCGFCIAVVRVGSDDLKGASSKGGRNKLADVGWSVRYDHIDDHLFGRTLPKKTIDEWRHDEMESTVGAAAAAATAELEEPEQQKDEMEAADGPQTKERERRNRRQRKAMKSFFLGVDRSPPTHWQCCQCHDHNMIRSTTRCIGCEVGCQHAMCEYCEKFHIRVAN
ncbi:uncharacterized protein PgNI_07768 [Pyricularia grisea]|uniref:C2H2-type domain-containing protein n=1 Tax=Pyricularia grisea TaxID=148305 RepID=A0A6P8B2L9_PYRGI|nr:uncharacterized protein PgNI_07768 [Pyricularia grisea]TLD08953.1 hypothetical protein PgNI_07768 [Pyricularia grisea]